MKPKCYCIVWDTNSHNELTSVTTTFSLQIVREVLRNLKCSGSTTNIAMHVNRMYMYLQKEDELPGAQVVWCFNPWPSLFLGTTLVPYPHSLLPPLMVNSERQKVTLLQVVSEVYCTKEKLGVEDIQNDLDPSWVKGMEGHWVRTLEIAIVIFTFEHTLVWVIFSRIPTLILLHEFEDRIRHFELEYTAVSWLRIFCSTAWFAAGNPEIEVHLRREMSKGEDWRRGGEPSRTKG